MVPSSLTVWVIFHSVVLTAFTDSLAVYLLLYRIFQVHRSVLLLHDIHVFALPHPDAHIYTPLKFGSGCASATGSRHQSIGYS